MVIVFQLRVFNPFGRQCGLVPTRWVIDQEAIPRKIPNFTTRVKVERQHTPDPRTVTSEGPASNTQGAGRLALHGSRTHAGQPIAATHA